MSTNARVAWLAGCLAATCFSQTSSPLTWFEDLRGQNSGHTVVNSLVFPVSAAVLSMSDAASTGMMDATDIPVFTSNTALFTFQSLAATHCEWLMDTRLEYAGACFPIVDVGTVGGYARIFTPGSFDNAYTIDQEPSHPTMFDLAAGVSFARAFFRKSLSLGASISYVESRLDVNAVGGTMFAGADASYRPSPIAGVHLYADNIGPRLTYWDVGEPLPAQAGLSAEVMPFALREDISDIIGLRITAGAKKIADMPLVAGGGIEARMFKRFVVRAGYDYSLDRQPFPVGLGAGAGIDVGHFGADAGWKYESDDLGSVWAVSVRLNLREVVQKTAEDYYTTAQRFYQRNRKFLCVYNAKKALALDPNMWKAHALIAMVNTRERREKNLEIGIIYTGNTRAQFLPMQLEKGALGGLARMATIIRILRSQFPTSVLVDGGNMVTATAHPLKCQLAQTFCNDMGYDAAAVGDQELAYGPAAYFALVNNHTTGFVASNLADRSGLENVFIKKIILTKGYKIAFLSVISPSLVPQQDRNKLLPPLDELRRTLGAGDVTAADVRIIVVHDTWENMPLYASCLRIGDIILCASIKQEFAQPMKVGPAMVVSAGERGAYVGNLVLRFSPDKKLVSTENHLIPVTEEIQPDTAVEAKTRMIAAKTDLDSAGAGNQSLQRSTAAGVFAFCSKRRGTASIYLKVPEKNAEFPLTGGKLDCERPVVSISCSRVAYFERNPDSACPTLRIMDLAGTSKRDVPLVACATVAAFSPNGAWLYFSARLRDSTQGIFRIKPDGATVNPVVTWKNALEGDIAFSADGANMAFTSNGNGKWQLFLSNPDALKPVCLTDGTANYVSPGFGPGAKKIALLSDKTSFGGSRDLWVYDFSAPVFRQLTKDAKVTAYCWVNAGTIAYSAGGDTSLLYSVDVESKTSGPLIPAAAQKQYRETSPRLIGTGTSARIIYTREYNDGTKRIFQVKTDGSGDEAVVNSGSQDWLE